MALLRNTMFLAVALVLTMPQVGFGQVWSIAPLPRNEARLFGWELAFVGSDLMLGLYNYDTEIEDTGTVLHFQLSDTTWQFVGQVRPLREEENLHFGQDIIGTTERLAVASSKSVEVQKRVGQEWRQEFSDSTANTIFAFSDKYLAVGHNTASGTPEVIVHRRSDSTWTSDASIPWRSLFFREDVHGRERACFSDDFLILGDYSDTAFGFPNSGSVSVYQRIETEWILKQKLGDRLTSANGRFGVFVDCNDTRLVVTGNTRTFTFFRRDGLWSLSHILNHDRWDADGFLRTVAVHEEYLFMSRLSRDQNTGVVLTYRDDGNGYEFIRRLRTPNPVPSWPGEREDGYFGVELAVNDSFLAVGAPLRTVVEEGRSYPESGETFVFALESIDIITRPPQPDPRYPIEWSRVYPSPGRGSQHLEYSLSDETYVKIYVSDILGKISAILVDGTRSPGEHEETMDTRSWPTGVYFMLMQLGGRTTNVQKFVVR